MRQLALACLFSLCAAGASAEGPWKELERFDDVWKTATLIVEGIPNATVDDRSPHMRVDLPNGMIMASAEGGLVPLKEGLIFNKGFAKDNLLTSKYVALLPAGKGRAPLLVVLGRAYASDPGSIWVIGLILGKPAVLLVEEILEPSQLADLDGDGTVELIGNPSYAQSDGKCRKSYDPFAVYHRKEAGRFRYSLSLSEAYNKKHYAGWMGRGPREDLRVITCGKQKGRIVKVH